MILKYKKFIESLQIDLSYQTIDIMESLNIWHDAILSSVDAKEVDIFTSLFLPKEENIDIEHLNTNSIFLNSLASIGLKKSYIQNTDDYETFINKPCKFMFIYDINSNELENPEYILFQSWNESLKKWSDTKLYKVNDDIKKFFDKLTSKTIEILDGQENYIYSTSNGNDWELQNRSHKDDDTYKKSLRKEELQKILDNKKIKINII